MRSLHLAALAALSFLLMSTTGCGSGFELGPSGWTPTEDGYTGVASVTFSEVDDVGIDGEAALNIVRAGDQFTGTVEAVLDAREVSIQAGWGDRVSVSTCYDGPEELPEVCTTVVPSSPGNPGEICVTLGGARLPCYVLPAGDDGPGETGDATPTPTEGAPADGGYPDPEPTIDAASLDLEQPVLTTPTAPIVGPVMARDAG